MAANQVAGAKQARVFATVAEKVEAEARGIETDLGVLFLKFSGVDYCPSIHGFVVIDAHGNHVWRELPTEGKRLQGKVLRDYSNLCGLLKALLAQRPVQERTDFEEAERCVLDAVAQVHRTSYASTSEANAETVAQFRKQREFIVGLHSERESAVLISDTNALILGCPMQAWQFEGLATVELCLVPAVLMELDELKLHRREEVASKAKRIIRQVKEFGRRGSLAHAVPVVRGTMTLRTLTIEPKASRAPPWLDLSNSDDRILACTFEVMSMNPRSVVALVTCDINLQNKASFAAIPFLEPPMALEGGTNEAP